MINLKKRTVEVFNNNLDLESNESQSLTLTPNTPDVFEIIKSSLPFLLLIFFQAFKERPLHTITILFSSYAVIAFFALLGIHIANFIG
jgi:hypothetical protein